MEENMDNQTNQGTGDQTQTQQTTSGNTTPASLPWKAQLADEYKSHPELNQANITELAKGYLSYKSEASSALKMPGEKATPEEWATFYSKLGRPETPDGYKFDKIETPEWYQHDEEGDKNYRRWAHENGLPQKAAANLYKQITEARISELKEVQEILTENKKNAENQLRDTWKDRYDANRELSMRGFGNSAKKLLGDEKGGKLLEFANDSQLVNDPLFMQFFFELGKQMDSDKNAFGTGSRQGEGAYNKKDIYGNPMLVYDNTLGAGGRK